MKVDHLIADSNSFLINFSFLDYAEEIYCIPEVLSEIRDLATRERIQNYPFHIHLKEPSSDSIKLITKCSKTTGDYPSLSAVDIKVMALTYELTKEFDPDLPIKTEIEINKKTVIDGFKKMELSDDNIKKDNAFDDVEEKDNAEKDIEKSEENKNIEVEIEAKNEEEQVVEDEDDEEEDEDEEEEDDDDDEGWITPSNYKEKMKNSCFGDKEEEPEVNNKVACVTKDFAMQNVLLHMGLGVISPEKGKLIKTLRTFILRCYACFQKTSIMTKKFCPSCGNQTLKKVAVTYAEDGTQIIHLSKRVNITGRGKKFPLPKPKGGKHGINPILVEDQNIPQQRPSKMCLKKHNLIDIDSFIQGVSPFSTKDVYSRAAMLGIGINSSPNYWEKKNPNQSHKTTKKGSNKK